MTNTHSIKELALIEIALTELVSVARSGRSLPNSLELITERLREITPDIKQSLIQLDIVEAKKAGCSFTPDQIASIVLERSTVDDFLSDKDKAA